MKNNCLLQIAFMLCSFFVNAQAPTLTGFAPTTGTVGTTVIITGTNFDATPANNIVRFGGIQATISAASVTQLTVTVPAGATPQYMSVTNLTTHLAAYSLVPFIVTYPCGGLINAGSFAAKADKATQNNPRGMAVGDLDGDGKDEMAVANTFSNSVSVYLNTSTTGTITSAGPYNYSTGSSPEAVVIADLDRDGKQDMAVICSGVISIFRNLSTVGTLSFAAKVDITAGSNSSYGIVAHDMDGDGKPELIISNGGNGNISVIRNSSSSGTITTASFSTTVNFSTGSTVMNVAVGDIDGDGKADIAAVNQSSLTLSLLRNTCTTGTITAGSFAAKVDFATLSNPNDVAIGDLDADGKPEIAVVNSNGAIISVYKNTATSGTITASSLAAKVDFTASGAGYIAFGDIDGDGKTDIASTGTNVVSLFKNTTTTGVINSSSFAAKVDFATGTAPYDVVLGDLDGDGKLDITAPNNSANTFSTLRNLIGSLASMTSAPGDTTCALVAENLALTGNILSSFSWVATDNPNTTGESITTNTATTLNDVITNTTSATQFVIYTVTPTSLASTCPGTPQTVTITVNPSPVMTSTSNYTVCSNYAENLILIATVPSTYTWSAINNPSTTGESTTTQTTSVINNTVQNNGGATAQQVIYHVTPTDTLHHCIGTQQTVTITVQPKIYSTGLTSPFDRCGNSSLGLTISTNAPATYAWLATDNPNTTGESVTTQTTGAINDVIVTTSNQILNYTVTVTSIATGCPSVPLTVTVTVHPLPVFTITATPASASVCIGSTMKLAATGVSGSIVWSGGITDNVAFTPTITAVYSCTVTESSWGCSDTASKLITVKQLLSAGPISGTTALCSGSSATYSITPVSGATSYSWALPGGWTGSSTTNIISAVPGVSGTISATANNSCGPSPAQTLSVTVNSPTANAGPPSYNTCFGGSIQLNASSTSNDGANAQHYSWSTSSGLNNPNISNPIATPTVTTMYHLVATDTVDGCTGKDSINIIVAPISITANSGTVTCGSATTLTAVIAAGNYITPITYTWTPSSHLSITTGTTTSANPIATTTYYVTATTGNGCSGSVPSVVTVNQANFSLAFSATNQLLTSPPFVAQFTNSTPGMSGYTFTWIFGDGLSQQTNNTTVFHNYAYNGNYNVTLVAVSNTTGCSDTLLKGGYIFCSGGTGCALTATVTAPAGTTACTGDTVWLSSNTGSGYTYQWNFNGSIISGATNSTYGATVAGNYAVTISNGACSVVSSPKNVSFVSPPPIPIITTSGNINLCGGGSVILTASSGYVTYAWSTGATTQNTTVNSSGVYSVSVGNGTPGCTSSATYTLNAASASPPDICMVTVDSTSTNNVIYWDKTVYPITKIDSFIVYREVSTNIYKRVGAVSKDSLSMFIDNNRSVGPANGDPNIGAYRYKLQLRDSCGVYSALGPYHNSVWFNDQHTGTFTWNLYQVEFQATPVINFNLMRDSANIGDWRLVGSVSGNQTSLNDPSYSAYQFVGNWRVEATGFSCSPTLRLANNNTQATIIRSKSNITNNRTTAIGIDANANSKITVFPNPVTSILHIEEIKCLSSIEIYNLVGKKVFYGTTVKQNMDINLSDLQSGVYLIKISNERGTITQKIIKE